MSDKKVIALPGYSVPSNEPVARVIEILEEALAGAKSGQIVGVALVAVERQPLAATHEFHGEHYSRHHIMAGVMGLHYALSKIAGEASDE